MFTNISVVSKNKAEISPHILRISPHNLEKNYEFKGFTTLPADNFGRHFYCPTFARLEILIASCYVFEVQKK